jgi:hypothetical protein
VLLAKKNIKRTKGRKKCLDQKRKEKIAKEKR